MSKVTPRCLVCYKEGRTQKWVMTTYENHDLILSTLLLSEKVDQHSIFMIPACGMPFGGIWLCTDTHKDSRFSIGNFFEEYNNRQPAISYPPEAVEIADRQRERESLKHNSRYGFISPEGKYYGCEFEGHHSLAYDICFGQFDTDNPQRYLEEHGWCKIYNPMRKDSRYAVYVGRDYVLTAAQFKTLQELGLEDADFVSKMLVKKEDY